MQGRPNGRSIRTEGSQIAMGVAGVFRLAASEERAEGLCDGVEREENEQGLWGATGPARGAQPLQDRKDLTEPAPERSRRR